MTKFPLHFGSSALFSNSSKLFYKVYFYVNFFYAGPLSSILPPNGTAIKKITFYATCLNLMVSWLLKGRKNMYEINENIISIFKFSVFFSSCRFRWKSNNRIQCNAINWKHFDGDVVSDICNKTFWMKTTF